MDSKNVEVSDIDQRSALSIPPANVREHQLIVFDVNCQMAVDFNCNIVKIDQAGAAQSADPNIPWRQQRAWLVECIKDCAKIAKDYGVKCGLHNHTNTTVRENLEMINEVGSENLGLIIDADNATVLHEDVPETARVAGKDKILMCHLKDHKRVIQYMATSPNSVYFGHVPVEVRRACRVGEGIVDNVGFMKTVKSLGWDGYWGLESFGKENIIADLAWLKKTWKRV